MFEKHLRGKEKNGGKFGRKLKEKKICPKMKKKL